MLCHDLHVLLVFEDAAYSVAEDIQLVQEIKISSKSSDLLFWNIDIHVLSFVTEQESTFSGNTRRGFVVFYKLLSNVPSNKAS